jgi:hypothetical protein
MFDIAPRMVAPMIGTERNMLMLLDTVAAARRELDRRELDRSELDRAAGRD